MAFVPNMVMLLGRQSASLQSTLSTRFLRLLVCSTKARCCQHASSLVRHVMTTAAQDTTGRINTHQHWIGSAIIGEPIIASLQLQPYILPVGMSVV